MRVFASLVVAGAVAGVSAAGVGSYVSWTGKGRPEYRTVAAKRGDLVSTISSTGTLNAVVTVQVGSQISGMIKELLVDFNSPVRKGQLIARIDPAIFEARSAQAKADLENARAAVRNAQASVARAEADVANARANVIRADVQMKDARLKRDMRVGLFREGGISREERDTAETNADAAAASLDAAAAVQRAAGAQLEVMRAQVEAARAQVVQKQAAVDQAQVDLDHTFIRAPVDGIVISRSVDVGQTVAASLSAPTLFLIAQDLTKMQVEVSVDEADIGRVALDQPATFSVDSYPGQTFRGRVVQIRQAPQTVQNVVTYTVVVAVENPERMLKPGMTANVRILVARRAHVLVVPNSAFRVRLDHAKAETGPGLAKRSPGEAGGPVPRSPVPTGGSGRAADRQQVWILEDGRPESRMVRLGLSDGQHTEIEEGLAEGDRVIIAVNRSGGGDRPAQASRGPRLRL